MNKIKVLVADEQTLFREGICALLKGCKEVKVVGEATNGKEAIELVRDRTPDIVLMNIAMPIIGGAEATYRIRKENSAIKVLLLTQYEDRDRVISGLRAGANGYIPQKATASDLVSAIIAIHRGGYFLYPSVAKIMVDDYCQHIKQLGSTDPYDQLTNREKDVLKLTAEGYKGREIASLLDIASKTVLGHRTNIMRKLCIHTKTELVKYAIRKHLISPEG